MKKIFGTARTACASVIAASVAVACLGKAPELVRPDGGGGTGGSSSGTGGAGADASVGGSGTGGGATDTGGTTASGGTTSTGGTTDGGTETASGGTTSTGGTTDGGTETASGGTTSTGGGTTASGGATGSTCTPNKVCALTNACRVGKTVCTGNVQTCADNGAQKDGTGCDDANACTKTDTCQSGTCTGTAVTCAPSSSCQAAGVCNTQTGVCSYGNQSSGHVCGTNMTCNGSGNCGCASGTSSCPTPEGPACVNETSSAANCGACGAACAGSLACSGSACTQIASHVTAGNTYGCALMGSAAGANQGTIECWGSNSNGVLGQAAAVTSEPTPTKVPLSGTFRSVVASDSHACAIPIAADQVVCWGYNQNSDLGSTATAPPGTFITNGSLGISEIAASQDTTVTLAQNGNVQVLGGDGTTLVSNATHVYGSREGHDFCALVGTSLMCWGSIIFTSTPKSEGTNVISSPNAAALSLQTLCYVNTSGLVFCGGDNSEGELGVGDLNSHSGFQQVVGVSGAIGVASGYSGSCAWTATGSAYCWGDNTYGEIGVGAAAGQTINSGSNRVVPTPTALPVKGVVEISLGDLQGCVRLSSGQVECFGDNSLGDVGDGTTVERATPVNVKNLP